MRFFSKWIFRLVLLVLWLILSVFLGGFVLSVKNALGINVFSSTGYHAFERCLVSESHKALEENGLCTRK